MNEIRFEFGFSLAEVNMILQGLGHLPYKDVAPLLTGIKNVAQQKYDEYQAAAAAAEASAEPEVISAIADEV